MARMGSRLSHKTYWLWVILGSLTILVSRAVGSVAPDIEKIFNGFHRGAWHLQTLGNLYGFSFSLIGLSIIFLCLWMARAFIRRL